MSDAKDFRRLFEERRDEVNAYMSLLRDIDTVAKSGQAVRVEGAANQMTVTQLKILLSGLYLQLYNLVEATFAQAIRHVEWATSDGTVRVGDLSEKFLEEWVRSNARTHAELSPQHRLSEAIATCRYLIDDLVVAGFQLDLSPSGNLDDSQIEKLGKRIGLVFQAKRATRKKIKVPVRDGMGPMSLVKKRRNDLAHGSLSFVDCADGVTVDELEDLSVTVIEYLDEFVSAVSTFTSSRKMLRTIVKSA